MKITISGTTYTVTSGEAVTDPILESPYLLTPEKKRGHQDNYRLVRNGPRPNMLFPIGNKPFSPGGMPKWWVREVAPGQLEAAQ